MQGVIKRGDVWVNNKPDAEADELLSKISSCWGGEGCLPTESVGDINDPWIRMFEGKLLLEMQKHMPPMQDMSILQLKAQEIAIRLKIEKVTMESQQEAMQEMRTSRSQQQEIVVSPVESRHVEAEMQL